MTIIINVAKDFSKYPGGRFITDGPYSGEAFRNFLVAQLNQYENITIELNGVAGYSSGFLEECFGGLVRECGFSSDELRKRIVFDTEYAAWEAEIWDYIMDAQYA